MEISKQQMVEFAQWMDDAARTIEKWAQHAPEYFKKKGRLLPDIDRFDGRAQAIRDFLKAVKAAEQSAENRAKDVLEGHEEGMTPAPGQPPNDSIESES